MKKILLLLLFPIFVYGQYTGKSRADLTSHGSGNSTGWEYKVVFVDSGATYIGPFSVDRPPIGVAVTRDAVYDSATGYHWDSTWTASDFAYQFGFPRVLNDSARAVFSETDSLDFLPFYENDGTRYVVQADSMRYVELPPVKMAGAKYFYLEFYDSTGDSLIAQTEPRTLVLFYREY